MFLLFSCMAPTEKGSVKLSLDESVVNKYSRGVSPKIDSVSLSNDELKVVGKHFNSLKSVKLNSQSLSIISKTDTSITLSAPSVVTIALNTVLNLVIQNSYGAATVPVTFNVVDSSITEVKIADDAITSDKIKDGEVKASDLDSMGLNSGQVLQWSGTQWQGTDLSGLIYRSGWDAVNNVPDLVSGTAISLSIGDYFITTDSQTRDLGYGTGAVTWNVGDWLVWNGTDFDKIDNSTGVKTFNGRSGTIIPMTNDYTWNQIDKTTSDIGDIANVDTTGVSAGKILKYDGTNWVIDDDLQSGGVGSVSSAEIQDGAIVDADISNGANISQAKISGLSGTLAGKAPIPGAACGTTNKLQWNGSGFTCVPDLDTTIPDTNTNAGTLCSAGQYLDGDGTCKSIPVDTNTNAQTLCTGATFLDGDGNCVAMTVDTNTNADTLCSAGQYLDGDGTCKAIPVGSSWSTSGSDIYFSTGNVGIGENSPTTLLSLAGTDDKFISLDRTANANVDDILTMGVAYSAGGGTDDYFYTGFTGHQFVLRPSGNIGIGNNDPDAKLSITGNLSLRSSEYKWANKLGIPHANAAAGDRILLTLPAGAQSTKVKVRGVRSSVDVSSFVDLEFDVALTRGGDDFKVLGSKVDNNFITYQWYFDSATQTARLRFGQTGNTYTFYIYVSSTASGEPTAILDTGTPPTGVAVSPNYHLESNGNYVSLSQLGTERLRLDASGNLGVGTTTPTSLVDVNGTVTATAFVGDGSGLTNISGSVTGSMSLDGDAARNISVDRHSTADTAGNNLTLSAGGATSGATDKNGGNLVLSSGTSTGTGSSNILFQTSPSGSTGTTDNTPATAMAITGDGNIGIGTSSPTAKLDIQPDADNMANFVLRQADTDNALTAGTYMTGDGFLRVHNSDGSIGAQINGSVIGLYTYFNSGNVGIGTSTPASQLHIEASSGNGVMTLSGSSTSNEGVIDFGDSSTRSQIRGGYGPGGGGDITFMTDTTGGTPTDRMYIGNNGNVGIGTTTPSNKLTVESTNITGSGNVAEYGLALTDGSNTRFTIGQDANYNYIQTWNSKPLAINTEGNNTLINTGSGNVGIGTSSPNTKLHVNGSSPAISLQNSGHTAWQFLANLPGEHAGGLNISNGTANIGIHPSGNVGIGTTSPNYKLDVNGTFRASTIVSDSFGAQFYSSEAGKTDFRLTLNTNDADLSEIYNYQNGSSPEVYGDVILGRSTVGGVFVDGSNGNVGIGTTTPEPGLEIRKSRWTEGGNSPPQLGIRGSRAAIALYDDNEVTDNIHAIENAEGNLFFYATNYTADDWGIDERVARMMIQKSTGNIGIGTASPNSKLEVAGTIHSTSGGIKLPDNTVIDAASDLGASSIDGLSDAVVDGNSFFIGDFAGANNDGTNNNNLGIGQSALNTNTTGYQHLAIGNSALSKVTAGSYGNIGIGYTTGFNLTTGKRNVAIGAEAMKNYTTGDYNIAIGVRALGTAVSTTASNNIGIGYTAGYSNTNGANIFLGNASGFNNDGGGNIFIGNNAGYNETGSNKLYIENSTTSTPLIGGDFSANEVYLHGKVGVGTATPETQMQVTGGGLCVGNDATCNSDNNTEGVIYAVSSSVTAADYAEYFYSEGSLVAGDLVGLNPETGLARYYQDGDRLLGIVSTAPGVVGNRNLASEENTVLVALMGQVPVNSDQIIEEKRVVRSLDGKVIGHRLASGDVYLNISSVDEDQNRRIASLESENAEIKSENEIIKSKLKSIETQNELMKQTLCEIKPEASFCK